MVSMLFVSALILFGVALGVYMWLFFGAIRLKDDGAGGYLYALNILNSIQRYRLKTVTLLMPGFLLVLTATTPEVTVATLYLIVFSIAIALALRIVMAHAQNYVAQFKSAVEELNTQKQEQFLQDFDNPAKSKHYKAKTKSVATFNLPGYKKTRILSQKDGYLNRLEITPFICGYIDFESLDDKLKAKEHYSDTIETTAFSRSNLLAKLVQIEHSIEISGVYIKPEKREWQEYYLETSESP